LTAHRGFPETDQAAALLRRLAACGLVAAVLALGALAAAAAETAFPFGRDLMLDGKTTRGHKRLPSIAIEQDGSAAIELWCGSLRAQAAVGNGTITITPGARDNAQCDPERIAGDDDLLDMIVHMTKWRRSGDTVEFSGPSTLRFHLMTN
jgi:heat shock protein HslJ